MSRWLKPTVTAARFCGDCALTMACWLVWIALGALLAVQIGIGTRHELTVPKFVLRGLEERFAAARLTAQFGRTTFDPTGRILLENVQLSLPEFAEPILRARAVFIELDPWALAVGSFAPRRVQATDITLFVPAMLSPSGRSEELLDHLDLSLLAGERTVTVEQLATRIAGVAVTAAGSFSLPARPKPGEPASLPLIETLARHYAGLSRQLSSFAARLAMFEQPELHLDLRPSDASPGALAEVTLTARRWQSAAPRPVDARELRLTTRLALGGGGPSTASIQVTADELFAPGDVTAGRVRADARGTLNAATFAYTPSDLEVSADWISAGGFEVRHPSARLAPDSFTRFDGRILVELAGEPVALAGTVDLAEKSARVHLEGAFSPALLEPIGVAVGRDIRRFVNFGAPIQFDLQADLAPGWKFTRTAGRIAARQIDAYSVPIDEVHGDIEFDGRHFVARHASARLGPNFARGSFEQDLQTLAFRFLLEGWLRPLDIGGWFRGGWWQAIFQNFEFPSAPPDASVDVAGRWRLGRETTVFVFAESNGPIIRGAKFDYGRTRLFIRPNFLDGLEAFGTRGVGEVRGTFVRHYDFAKRDWSELNLSLESTLDLAAGKLLLGPALAPQLDPFTFERSPHVKVEAFFEGPAAPRGPHQTLRIDGQSIGASSAYLFPSRNLSFDAEIRDDVVVLRRFEAEVAQGTLTGNARVWGPAAERRLGFDAVLRDASLGETVGAVARYAAIRKGDATPPAADKFLPGKNNVKLELALSAEGRLDDPFSYTGSGNASLLGAELGEIRLLGLLSELLNFTSLRFNAAQTEFKIAGPKVVFSTVNVTGNNSAVQAHGDYLLDRRTLDFNARVYPFHESKNILQSVMGAVLSPLSTVLEVKLTGAIDNPSWAFVVGPTNLFRSLTQPSGSDATATEAATPSPSLNKTP